MFIFNVLLLFITFSLGFYIKMRGYLKSDRSYSSAGSFLYILATLMIGPIFALYFQNVNYRIYMDLVSLYPPVLLKMGVYLLLVYLLCEVNTSILYYFSKSIFEKHYTNVNKNDEE